MIAVSNECECGFRPALVACVSGKSSTSDLLAVFGCMRVCGFRLTLVIHISGKCSTSITAPRTPMRSLPTHLSCVLPPLLACASHSHVSLPHLPARTSPTRPNVSKHWPPSNGRAAAAAGRGGEGRGRADHCAAVLRKCARSRRVEIGSAE